MSKQSKKKISGKLKKTFGKIEYSYPSKIRFEQNKPEKIVWVSNPQKTWFYQGPFIEGEPGQLQITSTKQNSLSTFFDTLKNGLKNNSFYRVTNIPGGVELTFEKKSTKDLGIVKATIFFRGEKRFQNIYMIHIMRPKNNRVKLALTKMATNMKYKDKNFIFVPPPNTQIDTNL